MQGLGTGIDESFRQKACLVSRPQMCKLVAITRFQAILPVPASQLFTVSGREFQLQNSRSNEETCSWIPDTSFISMCSNSEGGVPLTPDTSSFPPSGPHTFIHVYLSIAITWYHLRINSFVFKLWRMSSSIVFMNNIHLQSCKRGIIWDLDSLIATSPAVAASNRL